MATNFLRTLGTAGVATGYIVAPLTVISSAELSGLANLSTALSSASGTLGVFTPTSFGQAPQGLIWLTIVTASSAVSAGGNLSGWWLHGVNSSTSFEASNATTPPPRPPDFIIPLSPNTAFVGSTYFATGVPALPYDTVKVLIQNNSGATLGAGNHTITVGPVADQY